MSEWMVWLKTGIPAIDADHKRIVKLITLARLTPNDAAIKFINEDFLHNIFILIKAHFEREEDIMFSLRYKKLNDHITDHSMILTALSDISKRYGKGSISLNEIFNRILLLDDHKKTYDTQLTEFINNAKSARMLNTVSAIKENESEIRPSSGSKPPVHRRITTNGV
ncbi:MAG: hemerythrin family protein [Rhodospirillaceae bacterium]